MQRLQISVAPIHVSFKRVDGFFLYVATVCEHHKRADEVKTRKKEANLATRIACKCVWVSE